MSIRMRSEPTSRRIHPSTSHYGMSTVRRIVIVTGAAVTVLVGCSQGDASDAEQGKYQDAQRTAVIDGLQATESARLLLPGTPEPTTTEIPE